MRKKFAEAMRQPVTRVHFASARPSPRYPVYHHPAARFLFSYSGRKHITWAESGRISSHILEPGEAVVAPPGCWLREHWDLQHRMVSVIFFENYVRVIHIAERSPEQIRPGPDCFYHTRQQAGEALATAFRTFGLLNPDSRAAVPQLQAVMELVAEELQAEDRRKLTDDELLWQKFCDKMPYCYRSDISRETLAQLVGIHPAKLSRLIRKFTGAGLCDYIRTLRLNYAILLLREKITLPVEEVAFQCGFNSASYFIQVFRQRYGIPPGTYREQLTSGVLPAAFPAGETYAQLRPVTGA